METENEFLRESLEREKENKHVETFGSDTLLEELSSEQFGNEFHCEICGKGFGKRNDLNFHNKETHGEDNLKDVLNEQTSVLETAILKQKSELFSKLIKLKESEEKYPCTCKSFCKIHHKVYNWIKPMSTEMLSNFRNIIGEEIQVETEVNFPCTSCDTIFRNPEDLQSHNQTNHAQDDPQKLSVNPWGLHFLDMD